MGTRTIFAVLHDFVGSMDDAVLGATLRLYCINPSERSRGYLPQGVSVIETRHTDDEPRAIRELRAYRAKTKTANTYRGKLTNEGAERVGVIDECIRLVKGV